MKYAGVSVSRQSVGGFALVETLIAFIVMAVGLLALLSFHSESQRNISESKSQAEAVAIAEAKLQELESYLSTSADNRLDAGTSIDTYSGEVTSFNRSWQVENLATGDGKRATVTVTWTDRNGSPQSVILSSEIFFGEPTQGLSDFLRVVDVADKVYGADNAWGTGTDTGGGPGGDRDVVESIAVDQYDGYVPDGYELDYVYIFRIYINGVVVRQGNNTSSNSDVEEVATELAAIESIDGITSEVYEPTCNGNNSSYSCELYYLSTSVPEGWTGIIGFTLGNNDIFCSHGDPGEFGTWAEATDSNRSVGSLSLEGQLENMWFDIEIADTSCN